MAEIDWDKIIKAARSRKEEEDKSTQLEKRLHRMEKILDKLASDKASGPHAQGESGQPQRQDYHPVIQKHVESDRKDFAPKTGFSIPKFGFNRKDNQEDSGKARHPSAISKLSIPAAISSPSRRTVAAVVAIAAVVVFSAAFITGNLPSSIITDNPLTGLFGIKPAKPSMLYVCGDGITTVENLTMCPTSTTSSVETTIATTTLETTSTSSTTTSVGAAHSISLKGASCNGASITMQITNAGTALDNTVYLVFMIDGTPNQNVICTPLTMGPGETVTCISSGTLLTGAHSVEVRGLVNAVKSTVSC
jgi:hypothetical protein